MADTKERSPARAKERRVQVQYGLLRVLVVVCIIRSFVIERETDRERERTLNEITIDNEQARRQTLIIIPERAGA